MRCAIALVREVVLQKEIRGGQGDGAEHIPVQVACPVLDVSVSGYYGGLSQPPSARAIRQAWLTDLIVEVHQRARGTYGARRVHAELRFGRGIVVGHGAVAMLVRRAGHA